MVNGNGNSDRQSDLWEIIGKIQAQAGGGRAKAVKILLLFDERGKIIGKTHVEAVDLYPGGISEFLKMVLEG